VAENPYGGMIPELLGLLDKGNGYDLYRLLLLEASVYGCNMSVPYGGWMGNTIKDAFYPPRDVTAQVQAFLADHEEFFSKESGAKIMVIYSFPSYYWEEVTRSYSGNVMTEENNILFYTPTDITDENTSRLPFWEVIKELSDEQVVYDVKILGDNDVCARPVSVSDFASYELVILPACDVLTENQAQALTQYINQGGKLLLFGDFANNLQGFAETIITHKNVLFCENAASKKEALKAFREIFSEANKAVDQVRVDNPLVGVHLHKTGNIYTMHLLNYNYDTKLDKVIPIPVLSVRVRIPYGKQGVKLHTLDGKDLDYSSNITKNTMNITIHDMPLYLVAEFI
jgi:hypothetical protein